MIRSLRYGRKPSLGIMDLLLGRPKRNDTVAARQSEPFALTPEERDHWNREGYLILRGCISRSEIDLIQQIVDRQWADRAGNDHEVDVLSGDDPNRTYKLHEISPDLRNEAYKLNNLFARISEVREVALSPRLAAVCTELLEGEPLICNSLNFERGSQQMSHIDSWYMPPPVEGRMIAASISLDDVDETNGPICYYPGSHLIPPYRFSNGLLNEIPAEGPACRVYIEGEVERRGLAEVEFNGKAGDVFIWNGQLLHGGRPIRDFQKTRKSLVVHYWRTCDLPAEDVRRHSGAGSYLGHTLRGEISF
jgi:phytanoyl-CoA hydroxylase